VSAITLPKSQRQPRARFDEYHTPRAFVETALALVEGTPCMIMDPGAGSGVWGEVARAKWPAARIHGVEIQPVPKPAAYDDWIVTDYRTDGLYGFDLIMGNPPFVIAEAFVRHSIEKLNFGGVCLFLLRLAFLESARRGKGLFREFPPALVSVCSRRPVFYGSGSGATAFCYCLWRKAHTGETRLTWSET